MKKHGAAIAGIAAIALVRSGAWRFPDSPKIYSRIYESISIGTARWMISNIPTTERTAPNFLNYVFLDGLKAVEPGAVNVIR